MSARYHCFHRRLGRRCREVTIPPRGLARLEDIVATLFAAPESGGAIDSRVGTDRRDDRLSPAKPAPTLGMFVPGLFRRIPPQEHPDLAGPLVRRNWSANEYRQLDPDDAASRCAFARGMDGSTSVTGADDPGGRGAGCRTNRSWSQPDYGDDSVRTPSSRAILGDSIYAYAAVIDNQSQGPFSSTAATRYARNDRDAPRRRFAPRGRRYIFHSDIVISNIDSSGRRRARLSMCVGRLRAHSRKQADLFAAGQSIELEDVVATTLDRPESGGTVIVEANGPWSRPVGSIRPSYPQPTVGMFVPGLSSANAATRAILGSLWSSRDLSTGSRVNVERSMALSTRVSSPSVCSTRWA